MNDRKDGIIARYGEEKSRSATPKVLVSISVLLFIFMPAVSAQIDIVDIGTSYDPIDHYGYVDYQNTGNCNVSCALLVFIDDELVATELRDMPIRYVAGFRCSPVETLEFPLNMSKGNHTILAHALTQNVSLERTFKYYAEDWWTEDETEEDAEEEVEDWLSCPSRGLQHESSHSHNYPFVVIPVPMSWRKFDNCTNQEVKK